MDNKSKRIQVVLCEPMKKARIVTIANTLASLQQIAGGYIEAVYPFDDPVAVICNEEGKINGMELNRALRDENGKVYDILAGTFLIVGLGEENFAALTLEYQEKYCKLFEYPEVFLSAKALLFFLSRCHNFLLQEVFCSSFIFASFSSASFLFATRSVCQLSINLLTYRSLINCSRFSLRYFMV